MVEHDVLILHQVAFFGSQNGISRSRKEVFHRDFLEHFRVEISLDNKTAQFALLQAFLEDVLLYCVNRDEPVDVDCLRLTNSMAAILRLLVHSRVPVSVVEDDAVSASQVDADTTTPRRGNEAENLLVNVELVDQFLTSLDLHGTVQSHVCVPVQVQKAFKHIEHSSHLRKNQHF